MANQYKRISASSGSGGGSGTSNVVAYSTSFVVGSWAGPTLGEYSFAVSVGAHGAGLSPIVQVEELDGSDYKSVDIIVEIDSSGNIALIINDTPDVRFGGRVKIVGE